MSEPVWLSIARSLIGTREVAGPKSNSVIIGWAQRLGVKTLGIVYNSDGVPWCGVFVANCLSAAGVDLSTMRVAVRAKAWSEWGANLRVDRLAPGAILVFEREGGGHVGFYVGEDATHFHVLGGNQSDAVNIMRIARSRLVASRWPRGVAVTGGPRRLTAAGAPVSRNEA